MNVQDVGQIAGQCYAIACPTSSPPTGVQIQPAGGSAGTISVDIMNTGANAALISYGPSAAAAQTSAVFPVTGTPQNCVVIPPNFSKRFEFPAGSYFSGLALTATANVYLTPLATQQK